MTLSKPPELTIPEYVGGRSFYGSLTLGDAGQLTRHMMLVTFDGTETPVLYMDRNGDNDLTNDGPRLHLVNSRHRTLEPVVPELGGSRLSIRDYATLLPLHFRALAVRMVKLRRCHTARTVEY